MLRTVLSTSSVRAITRDMNTYVQPSRDALKLAGASGADPRTCERAIREGVAVIRTRSAREAIESAARELRIALGGGAPKGRGR